MVWYLVYVLDNVIYAISSMQYAVKKEEVAVKKKVIVTSGKCEMAILACPYQCQAKCTRRVCYIETYRSYVFVIWDTVLSFFLF